MPSQLDSLVRLLGVFPVETLYLLVAWNPIASIVGGVMFGYGMALAGNCGFGALARFGGGDLRSFVIILVMGLSAFAVISGPLAHLRLTIFSQAPVTGELPGIAHLLGNVLGISPLPPALLIGLAFIALALSSADMRSSPDKVFWGAVVGLAIV